MASTKSSERNVAPEASDPKKINGLIGASVLQALGKPGQLREVQVKHLWQNHYRVNVFVGDNATSVKISHSFFMVANPDGGIVSSIPEVKRHYAD